MSLTAWTREQLDKVKAQREIDELKRQNAALRDELEALGAEIEQLKAQSDEWREIDELKRQNAALVAEVKELKSQLRQEKLVHIGFTNESQVQYVTEDKEEGAFYPNSDHGCYIPVYMLNVHAHRVGPDSKIYCTQLEQGKKINEIRAEAVLSAIAATPTHRIHGTLRRYHAQDMLLRYAERVKRGSNEHGISRYFW